MQNGVFSSQLPSRKLADRQQAEDKLLSTHKFPSTLLLMLGTSPSTFQIGDLILLVYGDMYRHCPC